mmetsp:Transcript_24699/g.40958  ORF Transcript_24699/g.40958 Transcript_24699/m.40958 type:complete len:339 (+) Transcript_24699:97-1113(+)|eukprot:CAMPEP_0119326950 /NCGR_PEP_ID=MMETSP1333-20130426/69606_1 /TAXON_ID=418940 /ORGANISM="Scyphosphaera apsteinii, Strain RCC1455" /LENGTH=338 /DNA_ID=CAMNT_0007335395 /DNA_START=96 /DNA_END=1112 /DNA_ORIENTATION=-
MGNFLDTPITEKESSIGEDARTGLSYGVSAMQGWRAQMEDDHVHMLGLPNAPDISLFGVYDGHGGDLVAHYVAKNFPRHLEATNLMMCDSSKDDFMQKSKEAFEAALMSIDAELRALPEVESGQDQSGSTSVMTLVSPKHIICANTGDSRAVLSRDGTAVPLSHDHKPFNAGEKERIEMAGGSVKFNRVNGDLAVSRALGDFVYKRCSDVNAEDQAVTAFPEMIMENRQGSDEFIVLACDGIWDVMTSQDVVDKVRNMLLNGRPKETVASEESMGSDQAADTENAPAAPPRPWDLAAVCETLIDQCLQLGSRDNMSVIIVTLQPAFKPKPEHGSSNGS